MLQMARGKARSAGVMSELVGVWTDIFAPGGAGGAAGRSDTAQDRLGAPRTLLAARVGGARGGAASGASKSHRSMRAAASPCQRARA